VPAPPTAKHGVHDRADLMHVHELGQGHEEEDVDRPEDDHAQGREGVGDVVPSTWQEVPQDRGDTCRDQCRGVSRPPRRRRSIA
jgi:hypothetical protein